MSDLVFEDLPSIGGLLVKAATPKASAVRTGAIPHRTAIVAAHNQDVSRLAAYDRLCGFTLRDRVPPTWLHVLAFPLQAALMAQRDFPYALAGLVHARNSMTLHRPVTVSDELALIVRAEPARAHRKGAEFDLVSEVRVGGETAWTGISTYLARGARAPGSGEATVWQEAPPAMPAASATLDGTGASDAGTPEESGLTVDGPPSQQWRLPGDLGRRYAGVSGDVNPLHLNALAARAFGFKRPIIHGMWTHARALAALGPRLPETYTVSVRFTKPILLPARVGFATSTDAGRTTFAVLSRDGRAHLLGEVEPATP
ncbi:MAG: MaoC/PaaZ C-terminal domain-containing protein [Propioniciclava sp.]|uniref:MaoC/PaaZ C-terminal domain-containing protein n=1 Tax=Propioniciclava sp. TaxID=2038686 RepID=UPI0039E5EC65